MASTFQKGKWGETLALNWLTQHDFQIIDRNWFYGHAEIDIIAWHAPVLVFIEVRLLHRTSELYTMVNITMKFAISLMPFFQAYSKFNLFLNYFKANFI